MEELSSQEVVEQVFERLVKYFDSEEIEFSKYPYVEVARDWTKKGISTYKKVFIMGNFVISIGYAARTYITEMFLCDISLVPISEEMEKEDIFRVLEKSKNYEKSLIIAISDGGLYFPNQDIREEIKKIENAIEACTAVGSSKDYEYNKFREPEIKYKECVVEYIFLRIVAYIEKNSG